MNILQALKETALTLCMVVAFYLVLFNLDYLFTAFVALIWIGIIGALIGMFYEYVMRDVNERKKQESSNE